MSMRKSLNSRQHTIPANAQWIDFERTDGEAAQWPVDKTTETIDDEGHVNFMRPMSIDENTAILWRKTIGKFVAQAMGKPEGEYVLRSWPKGYQLFDHNKGPAGNPRHDPYLYGSTNTLRFRSANEFAPHAAWLLTDPTLNRANCECKYCAKMPQRDISVKFGLSQKRSSDSPSPAVQRRAKRVAREVPVKPPHAAVRRAPRPPKQRLTGPTQWLVPDKNNDVRDALGRREVKAIRYFRRGELVWCLISPPILVPGNQEIGIGYWPGLVDNCTTKSETVPRATAGHSAPNLKDSVSGAASPVQVAPSASRPGSPASSAPTADITWTVRQHTSYKIKLLATSTAIILSEDDILPYLAFGPPIELLDILRNELPEAVGTAAVQELDESETKMFDFNPVTPTENPISRFKQAVVPYTLAIQIGSNMARYWTPTDEWECKFTVPPNSPSKPPSAPSVPAQESMPSLHSIITSAMAQNAQDVPGSSIQSTADVSTRILGQSPRAPLGTEPEVITQLRYQGLWWGAERIWTDELVRLKLARCQFAPQGGELVSSPAGPSDSTIQWNVAHGVVQDSKVSGAGEKGLFMLLEGLFVVEVPQADGPPAKECRASGTLYELVDDDWKEESGMTAEADGKGKGRADGASTTNGGSSAIVNDVAGLSSTDATLKSPVPMTESPSATQPPESTKNATMNGQLSHPPPHTPYPLPDAPDGYRFRPILAPGHEVVLSLSLISGRYYPRLFQHPLLQPTLQEASSAAANQENGLYLYRHLWALEGLLPGVHQSMEPKHWKNGRHLMFREASKEAREEFDEIKKEAKAAGSSSSQKDIVMTEASSSAAIPDDTMIDPALLALPSISVST